MTHTHARHCNWNIVVLMCMCVCVHAGSCACVCAPLLPTHGNVAQSIGEYLWGMLLALTTGNWSRRIGWWNRCWGWVTLLPTTQTTPLLATWCTTRAYDAIWIIIFTNCINIVCLARALYHMLSNCIWRSAAHMCVYLWKASVKVNLWKNNEKKIQKMERKKITVKGKLKLKIEIQCNVRQWGEENDYDICNNMVPMATIKLIVCSDTVSLF